MSNTKMVNLARAVHTRNCGTGFGGWPHDPVAEIAEALDAVEASTARKIAWWLRGRAEDEVMLFGKYAQVYTWIADAIEDGNWKE